MKARDVDEHEAPDTTRLEFPDLIKALNSLEKLTIEFERLPGVAFSETTSKVMVFGPNQIRTSAEDRESGQTKTYSRQADRLSITESSLES